MKAFMSILLVLAAIVAPVAADETGSPVGKVLSLLADLEAKILADGDKAQKVYEEYTEWCKDTARNTEFEIKTGKAEVEELTATIEEAASNIDAKAQAVEELAAEVAKDEADLKEATGIREEEHATFVAEEKELIDVTNTLQRAIGILDKELNGGASMLQLQHATSIADALKVMVKASALSAADASKLTALVQNGADSDDSDTDRELGAPAGAVYESQSGGIISTMEGLLADANGQLETARSKEKEALRNFEMLESSLEFQIKNGNKDIEAAKQSSDASKETKATAEGDLSVSQKDLAEDTTTLTTLHNECMTVAQDFETETKSRGEELKAIKEATKIIKEAMASSSALNQVSFVQVKSTIASGADLANFEAVRFIKDLAKKERSPALAQLAARMNSVVKIGGSESDVFAKIKTLIGDMITKLEKDAEGDASHKAYCDKETAETTAKKEEKTAEVEKLTTKIEQASAQSAKLKEEVATLQKELAELAKSQAEMDKLRMEEKALFTEEKAEMEKGLSGIKKALQVLNDYYSKDASHGSSGGASTGIISLLETVESDFSKSLAEAIATEESAAHEYEVETQENKMSKTMKDQDLKYKTKEFTSLDKTVTELKSDRESVQAELDAVLEYEAKINDMCIAKAEPYEERKARREAEIAGLKEALEILEGETVLLQAEARRGGLRGVKHHRA
eukprot:gnl/TRDRNA2_/TRDRNA2_177188_c12_seq23.p1 gnl/TRDRNA2_/TRDRNA2_177188_c12~~gnl/TRDRNA2_/TRDRNA2_177188_c12_seq23.p1  ORF type:complete len:686 (+),score=283.52 gnl/TRDRNA2_/TRDRNA2_177188_c12_seq23:69-2126(+)